MSASEEFRRIHNESLLPPEPSQWPTREAEDEELERQHQSLLATLKTFSPEDIAEETIKAMAQEEKPEPLEFAAKRLLEDPPVSWERPYIDHRHAQYVGTYVLRMMALVIQEKLMDLQFERGE